MTSSLKDLKTAVQQLYLRQKMLRLATIEDAERIATIHVRTWRVAYEGIVPLQYLASLSIQERANLWRRVVAEQHGTVLLAVAPLGEVGFISFGPSRDKNVKEKAEIYAIYVLPEFWHQGIGGELLEEAEGRIELHV
jgi:GNAT superfamily N-acetyltransferase